MSRTRLRLSLIALSAAILTLSGAAHADSACLKDAGRFCSGIPIGEGRVLTCLQARWKDLSGTCQHEIQEVQNRAREFTLACTNDVWQFCQNVVPGGDRIRVCLWSRWDDLSSTCREKAAEVAEKAQQLWDQCGVDIDRLCPGMKPGGGQIYLCLKAQESKVSSQCRKTLR
ncbi:MAG TPA: cysteine rich repeat-containing protein [Myxococcaceae bacterium]|nr:cysteine rich repeat-containing protein [Myxococcaceae bacterium]